METVCKIRKVDCAGKKPRRHAACEVCWSKLSEIEKTARGQGNWSALLAKQGKVQPVTAGSLRRFRA